MLSNPIIRRFYYSQFRPSQFWTFASLYIAVVLLTLLINTSIYQVGQAYAGPQDLFRGLFLQFAILEVFLLWLLGPINCSGVITREIADKSFDFFRMLPLSAAQKTIGIVVGRNLFILAVSAINLLICLAFAVAGGLSAPLIFQMLAVLVTSSLALNVSGLLFSVLSFRNIKQNSIPVLLVMALFAFGPIVGSLGSAVNKGAIEYETAAFFGFEIPLLNLVSICLLYAAVWAYIGSVRRFTFEYEALFSRFGAAVFLISFLVLLLGLFYEAFYSGGLSIENTVHAFWMIGLLPVGIVPVLAMRGYDKYVEVSRRVRQGLWSRLFLQSNIVTGLLLFAVWFVFGVAVCVSTQYPAVEFIAFAVAAFSFLMVILAFVETYTVLLPKNEKIGYLLGFAAVLYCVLPLILHALFEAEGFALLSPLQLIGFWKIVSELTALANPLVLNAVIVALLSILIYKRYSGLAAARTRMTRAA